MCYITTFTGKHFDPTKPDMAQVDIRDIAVERPSKNGVSFNARNTKTLSTASVLFWARIRSR